MSKPSSINSNFAHTVLNWYQSHGRFDLPWQQNISPYRVWLSEIMLQQTQVRTVIPYFERFTQAFSRVEDLACAKQDEVLQLWTGLGYYARARNLHKCAQIVSQEHAGEFPKSVDELSQLPGIGRSTAGAIAAISMNIRAPILDGNVKRVLTRYFAVAGHPSQKKVENRLWGLAEQLLPNEQYPAYTQAMMDLGATLCTRSKPSCLLCPLQPDCISYAQGNPTAYPTPKKKKLKPSKHTHMLMIEKDGRILLEKRPQSGIWGGLWSLPETSSDTDLPAWCLDKVIKKQKLPAFRHTFSHYHLEIQPLLISITDRALEVAEKQYTWYHPHNKKPMGFPQPVAELLNNHFKNTKECL